MTILGDIQSATGEQIPSGILGGIDQALAAESSPGVREQEELQKMEDAFPGFKDNAFVRMFWTTLVTGTSGPASFINRLFLDDDEEADKILEFNEHVNRMASVADRDSAINEFVNRSMRSAAGSVALMAPAALVPASVAPALGRVTAAIGANAWTESQREAREKGFSPVQQAAYSGAQTVIEVAPNFLFPSLGSEALVMGRNAWPGVKPTMIALGKNLAAEGVEEEITLAGSAIAKVVSGIDPDALSVERLVNDSIETLGAVAFAVPGAAAVGKGSAVISEFIHSPNRTNGRKLASSKILPPGIPLDTQSERLRVATKIRSVAEGIAEAQGRDPREVIDKRTEEPDLATRIKDYAARRMVAENGIKSDIPTGMPLRIIAADVNKARPGNSKLAVAKSLASRWFTKEKGLGKNAFKLEEAKDGAVVKTTLDGLHTVENFMDALRNVYGGFTETKSIALKAQEKLQKKFPSLKALGTIDSSIQMPENDITLIDAILRGDEDAPIGFLPEGMRVPTAEARDFVDVLSRQAIESGAVIGEMARTFQGNEGLYLHTKHKAFTDPKWADNVPWEVRANFKNKLIESFIDKTDSQLQDLIDELLNRPDPKTRETQIKTRKLRTKIEKLREKRERLDEAEFDDQIEGLIERLLRDQKAGDTPISAFNEAMQTSGLKADQTVLFHKKDLTDAFRELIGIQKDPVVNLMDSIAAISKLIEGKKFMDSVLLDAANQGFVSEKESAKQGIIHKVPREVIAKFAPGNPGKQLFATKIWRDAFVGAFQETKPGRAHQRYMSLVSLVKWSKVVLNYAAHPRQIASNAMNEVAMGRVFFDPRDGATKAERARMRSETAQSTLALTLRRFGVRNNKEIKDSLLELAEFGLATPAATGNSSEIEAYTDDILDKGMEMGDFYWAFDETAAKSIAQRTGSGLKITKDFLSSVYASEDLFPKILAFKIEQANYRKAFPEWSEQQVKEKAADIVKNTTPTGNRLSIFLNEFRKRNPFTADFITFYAEIPRILGHHFALMNEELSDPRTVEIGARRAAGMMSLILMLKGSQAFTKWMLGIGDDVEDDLREHLPFYSENSQVIITSKKPDGKTGYIDFGYSFPYSVVSQPFMAFMRGEDWEESINDSMAEAIAPFADLRILTQRIIEVRTNRLVDNPSKTVYNEQMPYYIKGPAILKHLFGSIKPGLWDATGRIVKAARGIKSDYGKEYTLPNEIFGQLAGQRVAVIDPVQSMFWRTREYDRENREAEFHFKGALNRRGTVSDEELITKYSQMEPERHRLFQVQRRKVSSALRLGADRNAVIAEVRQTLSAVNTGRILTGLYLPFKVSKQARKEMPKIHGQAEAARRIALADRLYQEEIQKYQNNTEP